MKEIKLTQGYATKVDDEDFEKLNKVNWYVSIYKNHARAESRQWIKGKLVRMHRIIINCPEDLVVDHIDGDSLNNQKDNLRACTQAENVRNSKGKGKFTTSKFKGVSFAYNKYWVAQIMHDYTYKWLGYHKTETEAAIAYDKAALKYHGKYARTNKMMGLL